jgi:hypothetical protein
MGAFQNKQPVQDAAPVKVMGIMVSFRLIPEIRSQYVLHSGVRRNDKMMQTKLRPVMPGLIRHPEASMMLGKSKAVLPHFCHLLWIAAFAFKNHRRSPE